MSEIYEVPGVGRYEITKNGVKRIGPCKSREDNFIQPESTTSIEGGRMVG